MAHILFAVKPIFPNDLKLMIYCTRVKLNRDILQNNESENSIFLWQIKKVSIVNTFITVKAGFTNQNFPASGFAVILRWLVLKLVPKVAHCINS